MEEGKITIESFYKKRDEIERNCIEQIKQTEKNYNFISDSHKIETLKDIDTICSSAITNLYVLHTNLFKSGLLIPIAKKIKMNELEALTKQLKIHSEKALDSILNK